MVMLPLRAKSRSVIYRSLQALGLCQLTLLIGSCLGCVSVARLGVGTQLVLTLRSPCSVLRTLTFMFLLPAMTSHLILLVAGLGLQA